LWRPAEAKTPGALTNDRMAEHTITFDIGNQPVRVPTGTLLSEAAQLAGIDILQPCGGQGRCGRCTVKIESGAVRRRSSLRLSPEAIADGYALACQTIVEDDLVVTVPPQEKIERKLSSDRTVSEVTVPPGYSFRQSQTIQRVNLSLSPPNMDDQTDDWSRLQTALRQQADQTQALISLTLLRKMGQALRDGDWQVSVVYDRESWECPSCPIRLIDIRPGHSHEQDPCLGAAVDIGTTTVTVWLVDLISGQVIGQASEYNAQIARGEDVISRIIYASKNGGSSEMRSRVTGTINTLLERLCSRAHANPQDVFKVTISGNSTMIHLLLDIPATSIRLAPFVTAVNHIPSLKGEEVGLIINPEATVDCLPGVASYVGADISSGVLSSGLDTTSKLTLFLDVGTNGETVLGTNEWLVTCACSAGPAFEGAGVHFGMRATQGAIEEVWINADTCEPSIRVIGNVKPRGICGSGLISLLAELFMTGIVDKAGGIKTDLDTPRTRKGENGPEYVIVWAADSDIGQDIVLNHVDIDNLLRAKAAIYAGFSVLAENVGLSLDMVEQVLIGGSFGKYINVEKAIEIGLLPDMEWSRFQFLGNTSVLGAYIALLDRESRKRVYEIAAKMTYIELSADNSFYDAFMSAMFLPHTDLNRFPTVAAEIAK
jgi:uncharacterized 2Fe-2S/4Fe-4S cluster protein (DUF4445 family)